MKGSFIQMPRNARLKSYTKVYHVILRGINKQDIFLDDMDRGKFIKELKETKIKYSYQLYAYVLMDNHIHLLIYDANDNLPKIMQSITIAYSIYFNKKYDRCGHLFQNRYSSRCVEDTNYVLNLQRYIHQNPEQGFGSSMENYQWSSYQSYIQQKKDLVDINFILSLFDIQILQAISIFERYNQHKVQKVNMEYELINSYTDEEAIQLIKENLELESFADITKLNNEERDKKIKEILKIEGIRMRQIARILGVNRKIVERAIEKDNICPKKDKNVPAETSPWDKRRRDDKNKDDFCV